MPAYNYNNDNSYSNYSNLSDQTICGMRNGYYDTYDKSCTIGRVIQCNNWVCTPTTWGTAIDIAYWRNYYLNQEKDRLATVQAQRDQEARNQQYRYDYQRYENQRIEEQRRQEAARLEQIRQEQIQRENENKRIKSDCHLKWGYIQDTTATWWVCVVPAKPVYNNNYNYNNTKYRDDDFTTADWSPFLRQQYANRAPAKQTVVKKTYTKKIKRNYR